MADLAAAERAHQGAVAQHHDAVRAGLDLGQAVRHEDDRHAGALQVRHDREQAVGLGQGEARRRLVHDDELGVERQRLDDLQHLALGDGQRRHGRAGREVAAEPLQQRRHAPVQGRPVDEAQRAGAGRLAADEDVGGRVEVVEEVELLVHEGDAGAERLGDRERGVLDAADRDRAGGGRHDAAQHLHQRRLAGAVLADQPHHLAGMHGEADALEGAHAGVGLLDGAEFEQRLGHGRSWTGIDGASILRGVSGQRPEKAVSNRFRRVGYLPCIFLRSAAKASTLALSMILVGMITSPSFGRSDLSPSMDFAISFMPR